MSPARLEARHQSDERATQDIPGPHLCIRYRVGVSARSELPIPAVVAEQLAPNPACVLSKGYKCENPYENEEKQDGGLRLLTVVPTRARMSAMATERLAFLAISVVFSSVESCVFRLLASR